MSDSLFSERHGFAPKRDAQPDDYLPGWVREAITQELKDIAYKDYVYPFPKIIDFYPLFRLYIWKVLDTKPPKEPAGGPFNHYIPAVLEKCLWYQFYDILEQVSRYIKERSGNEVLASFSEKVNSIFTMENIPWKIEECKITRTLNPQTSEQIKATTTLLNNPMFQGPDEQFIKAINHLNLRPQPDSENCVKDAVGAVEAVANIIKGTQGEQLNNILVNEPFKSGIHPTISQSIAKIYAYRGAASGVAHGQTGPSVVTVQDAEWVLAMSAATIIYFVHRFPITQNT